MNSLGDASNIRVGDNPPYTIDDFKTVYPQFQGETVAEPILAMYLELAHHAVKEARWHSYWKLAMGLFVAHFVTLWVSGTADPGSDAAAIVQAGQAKGLDVSKSVGGVSMSKDYSLIASGLDGWAAWNSTFYGNQLATLAKLVGKGGMLVW